jgi:fatty acid CoA ligase FadD9
VLKLAHGEFVAVANLEAIYAGAPLIHQIFVYGNSERSSLLAVIVPTDEALSRYADPEDLTVVLRETLRSSARTAELQSYEVPVDFLIETEPFTVANGLLSAVGKLLRPKLKEHYGERLEQRYADLADARSADLLALRGAATRQPANDTVAQAARALLSLPATPGSDAHFTDLGGDSLSALNFSNLLGEVFGVDVPVGVIIGPSTDLASLGSYVEAERVSGGRRPTFAKVHGPGATSIAASDLTLDKFLDTADLRAAASAAPVADQVSTVLLTGANGYLGRFLALEWLQRLAGSGGRLIVLLRGRDVHSARRRLERAFDTGDPSLLGRFRELAAAHLDVVLGDIGEPRMGLDDATWQRLARDVDLVVHPAALVNHVLPYGQMFGPNVVGTAEVIRLAISERIKPVNYLSTVAVAIGVPDFVEDDDIRAVSPRRPIDDGYANGYANSKWAGEVLLREAHDLCGVPVSVFRSDQILAHSRFSGQLNVPDSFTRLLISLLLTGVAPRSFYAGDRPGRRPRAHYDGLPADFVAEAVTTLGAAGLAGFRSYDVMNPHDDGVSLDVIVDWLIDDGAPISRIDDHAEWFARFEGAMRGLPELQRQRSALALLDFYRAPERPVLGAVAPTAVFREAVHNARLRSAQDIPHIDVELIRKYMSDFKALGLV